MASISVGKEAIFSNIPHKSLVHPHHCLKPFLMVMRFGLNEFFNNRMGQNQKFFSIDTSNNIECDLICLYDSQWDR